MFWWIMAVFWGSALQLIMSQILYFLCVYRIKWNKASLFIFPTSRDGKLKKKWNQIFQGQVVYEMLDDGTI